ncbi:hypothetical protein [Maritalea mediterranea]|uniref:Membrane protein involved in the export of O-antigen and teichoic acid n=1 Tax=Maritalea mediterranea TaxID=2909667 RepID=A0ABS9E898_9HYPH|nr:hypothetical protein [Maritalea mediterranea]MCF4098409.1 hypothetical protein [Maritalea mediterranea]
MFVKNVLMMATIKVSAITLSFASTILLVLWFGKREFGEYIGLLSIVNLLVFPLTGVIVRELVRKVAIQGGEVTPSIMNIVNTYFSSFAIGCSLAILLIFLQFRISLILLIGSSVVMLSIFSALYRAEGRFVLGNLEAQIIRPAGFILVCFILTQTKINIDSDKLLLVMGVIVFVTAVTFVILSPYPLRFTVRCSALPNIYGLPALFCAGFELYHVSTDVIVANVLFGGNVAADVKISHQLKSLVLMPFLVYLMYAQRQISESVHSEEKWIKVKTEVRYLKIVSALFAIFGSIIIFVYIYYFDYFAFSLSILFSILLSSASFIIFGPQLEISFQIGTISNISKYVVEFLAIHLIILVLVSVTKLPAEAMFLLNALNIIFLFSNIGKVNNRKVDQIKP